MPDRSASSHDTAIAQIPPTSAVTPNQCVRARIAIAMLPSSLPKIAYRPISRKPTPVSVPAMRSPRALVCRRRREILV
jgi:hypothetical protein